MDIRILLPDDLSALLALYKHMHVMDDPLPDKNEVETVWSEIMLSGRFIYFGGFMESTLVSSCNITIIPNLTRGCRPYGVIENMVTHSQYRKRGFGTALLHAALLHAWSNGCYKVMLMTGRKDEATLRFYESAGFDPEGKRAFIAKPGD
jgi:GNAT superfamily N-acetyltransferase